MKLYIANKNYSSWSLRPWVLMRQLGIAFDEELVPFGSRGAEGFRGFSPSGRVPCLHDSDLVVWDSLAITEYLAERFAAVWPRDAGARAFARCAAAEMHSGFQGLRSNCGMNCGIKVRMEAMPAGVKSDLDRIDALWSEGLKRFGGPFLAGAQFTAGDAFFAPVAFRIQTYSLPMSPGALAYAQKLIALPAMREWYLAALAEPWIDAEHDEEVRRVGEIVEDLRLPSR